MFGLCPVFVNNDLRGITAKSLLNYVKTDTCRCFNIKFLAMVFDKNYGLNISFDIEKQKRLYDY